MTPIAGQDLDLTDAEFREISDVVYQYCGIHLHDGKKELVRARIAKQLRAGGFGSAMRSART
jgi:chemotaxis protein methyltransferase CheR